MYLSSNAVTSVRHGNHKPSLITLAANSQTAKLADNRAMYVQLIALKSLGSTAPKLLIMIFSREASRRLSVFSANVRQWPTLFSTSSFLYIFPK